MSAFIKQDRLERDARLYGKLDHQVQHMIRSLKDQIKNARNIIENPKTQESTRLVWKGQEIALTKTLSELEFAHDRTHY